MKITAPKDELVKYLSLVGRLSTTRATLPILQNIYLAVGKGVLTIKATDLEQTLEVNIDGEALEDGQITVPARMLVDYLQNVTDNKISLIAEDTTLKLESTHHQAKIKGQAAEDYPTLPKINVQAEVTLESSVLSEAITKTIFAAASDETRPILTGLLFRFKGTELTIVGTDGYRLAYVKSTLATPLTGDYILPKRSLQELLRLLSLADQVTLAFAASQARVRIGPLSFVTRVLDGSFPAYEAIVPKTKKISLRLNAATLLQNLKLASLFSRDSAYSTKLEIDGNKLRIISVSATLGENQNEMTLEKPVTEAFSIAANAQYLIDALTVMTDDIDLIFIDQKSPIVISLPNNDQYLYLVMPLRSE